MRTPSSTTVTAGLLPEFTLGIADDPVIEAGDRLLVVEAAGAARGARPQ